MAKVVKKEKFEVRGKVRLLGTRAAELATKYFGAKKKSFQERDVPIELLRIPPKVELIKKAPPEVIPEPTVIAEVEAPKFEETITVTKAETSAKPIRKGTKKKKQ
jgi:hypothetical protein